MKPEAIAVNWNRSSETKPALPAQTLHKISVKVQHEFGKSWQDEVEKILGPKFGKGKLVQDGFGRDIVVWDPSGARIVATGTKRKLKMKVSKLRPQQMRTLSEQLQNSPVIHGYKLRGLQGKR